jgi:hypothetical protein
MALTRRSAAGPTPTIGSICASYAQPTVPFGGDVMESDNWPLDRASAAELVVGVVERIDASDDEYRDALLSDLPFAAWGSVRAQNQ